MLRKILFAIFATVFSVNANAWIPSDMSKDGQIINIRYIHELVRQEHGVTIPYADDPNKAANMKYLLTIVDMVNAHFNGDGWTNYGNDPEYATLQAANTVAGIYCIRNLIERYYFTVTTTADTTEFAFNLGATGVFHVDWGDGTRDHFYRYYANEKTVSHTYTKAGVYTVRIAGCATEYNGTTISFRNNKQLAGISGGLGRLFPTLKDKKDPTKPMQPSFSYTFGGCTNLSGEIPSDLFTGIHGQPREGMFDGTFYGCVGLTYLPPDLFSGLRGLPTDYLFRNTFRNCSGLTGVISARLFSGIKNGTAMYLFSGTFAGCKKLTAIEDGLFAGITGEARESIFMETFNASGITEIPPDLFAGIYGKPAKNMFARTFMYCTDLGGTIPSGLFARITGNPQSGMFDSTFRGCAKLTGAIPDGLFGDIYGDYAANIFTFTFDGCKNLGTGITEENMPQYMRDGYAVPPDLFGGIKNADGKILGGNPKTMMFYGTFQACNNLQGKIPETLFGKMYGDAASTMFALTFGGCSGLTGNIPQNLFGFTGFDDKYLNGNTATSMFEGTFSGCSGLTGNIPANLFGIMTGEPTQNMFSSTFRGCSGLDGIIENALFGSIDGEPAAKMFLSTFSDCRNLRGPIPAGLFGKIKGAPKQYMFHSTFNECNNLDGNIPEYLFGDIYGEYAIGMFNRVFSGCKKLSGTIPPDIFGGIKNDDGTVLGGEPKSEMFEYAFSGCERLEGSIPDFLFGEMTGVPAERMFGATFYRCYQLQGVIPPNLFGNLSGDLPVNGYSFDHMFGGCSNLTGPSARINGRPLYEIWPDAVSAQVGGMYSGATNLSDYDQIPAAWK
ncbi:MAG: hypothetical protein R8N24_03080 [Alphaproteobacteria bacterium]|nr:hypothetical protein [Alphaproteobacteria bacterium]